MRRIIFIFSLLISDKRLVIIIDVKRRTPLVGLDRTHQPLSEMSPSPSLSMSALHPVLARYSSYTSIVHQEQESESQPPSNALSVQRLIQTTVEWLVILQRLEEERKTDIPAVSCR